MALEKLNNEIGITNGVQEFAIKKRLMYSINKSSTEHSNLHKVEIKIGKGFPFAEQRTIFGVNFFVKEKGDLRNNAIETSCQEINPMFPYPFEESEKMIKEFKTYWKENYPNMICS